ncbi:MAG: CinA family nicotinamide mononucleotide deamidase-related protein [Crocinitomix sp.]|nr:CinA family nicotinamide mononucleotide deamidase-related protein [Crocinitomix sp.]
MNAIIITIGDEILVGQTVDTNSAHIARELNLLGISIKEIVSISDTAEHIIKTVDQAIGNCDFLILTGGLGPTNDDITKKVLTDYFKDELVMYPAVLERIKNYFVKFNKPFLEVNGLQAMLPKKATILENELGTASGMWFKEKGCNVLAMPGVPYEMKGLLDKFTEAISKEYAVGDFYHRTVQVIGIGESYLAQMLESWEAKNRGEGISVSYLPSVGTLKLRLTGTLEQKETIDRRIQHLIDTYSKYVIGGEFDTIEKVIGALLVRKQMTLGTIESCTGGSIAKKIVSISGSSAFYLGSIISYTNKLKEELVGVKKATLVANGAVSSAVVKEMAENGRKKLGIDYCISVSGIAGPTGGSDAKPVGTIWIGIATPTATYTKLFNFGLNRKRNIQGTVVASLNFLRLILTDQIESE